MKNPISDIPHYLSVFKTYLGARIYIIFALTLFASVSEGLGLVTMLPLLQSLGSSSEVAPLSDGVNSIFYEIFTKLGLQGSTVILLLIITVAFVVKGALTFGAMAYSGYLRGHLLRELKERMFNNYSRMDYSYYISRDTGHFINVINSQIELMLNAFNALTLMVSLVISTLTYLILASLVAWRFGLMALAMGVVVLTLFRRLNNYVRQLSRQASFETGYLANLLIQTLHAFKYLTASGNMEPLRKKITNSIDRLSNNQIRSGIANAFTTAIREPIAVVFIMLILLTQVVFFKQPLAPIMVSILLFYRALNSVLGIQFSWQSVLSNAGGVEMVHQEFVQLNRDYEGDTDASVPTFSKCITLESVSFSYGHECGNVINDISFQIPVRTSIALVGASGSGKSTLVDLLTLLHKPTEGRILIDGVSMDKVQLAGWRSQIGYVSQETVIFDDTIANNICLWCGDPRNDKNLMQRVREASRQAHLEHFIDTLPDGFDTVVGDRGLRLSGGQRQRLFIARELFRKPKLLILDEATSALDSESEMAIQQSIENLIGHITIILIAHRLSTIRNVDKIIVLEAGKILEQGTYDDLRDSIESRFRKLVSLQSL